MEFVFLCFGIILGFFVCFAFLKDEEEIEEKQEEIVPEEKERDPYSLRNGYSTTRAHDPTFAEQIVNLINFSGENQKEGDYEETEN